MWWSNYFFIDDDAFDICIWYIILGDTAILDFSFGLDLGLGHGDGHLEGLQIAIWHNNSAVALIHSFSQVPRAVMKKRWHQDGFSDVLDVRGRKCCVTGLVREGWLADTSQTTSRRIDWSLHNTLATFFEGWYICAQSFSSRKIQCTHLSFQTQQFLFETKWVDEIQGGDISNTMCVRVLRSGKEGKKTSMC